MVSTVGNYFYLVDMSGRNLYRSSDLDDFIGAAQTAVSWQNYIHPDDLDCARKLFSDSRDDLRSFAGWLRLRRADGAYIWSLTSGTPFISDLNNVAIGVLGSICPMPGAKGFYQAGGLLGPKTLGDATKNTAGPDAALDQIADLILSANTMAREIGETELTILLENALVRIGFRMAERLKNPYGVRRTRGYARGRSHARRRRPPEAAVG